MKKLIGSLIVMTFLSAAYLVGCADNKVPSSPAASTPTKTATPTGSMTNTITMTVTNTATNTPTVTGTITPPAPTATPQATQAAVVLGTAGTYGVLAGSTITNTGATSICGNLGLWVGTAVTGSPAIVLSCLGNVSNVNNSSAQTAQGDLTTAMGDASARINPASVSGDLGGLTLYPGLYKSTSTLALTGTLTLDALGNSNAVFIFQVGSAITTSSSSQVLLTNSAQAANVFWQVSTDCTLGISSVFKGIIMAGGSITFDTGAALEGRALASIGAVTFDTNIITNP